VGPHHDHSAIYIRRTSRASLLIPALAIADFGTHQPVIQETKNGLSQSCVMFSSAMFTGAVDPYPDTLHFPGHGWIDVRDASTAHVRALSVPAAGGERILVCGGSFVWQDFSAFQIASFLFISVLTLTSVQSTRRTHSRHALPIGSRLQRARLDRHTGRSRL
jgi:hypothetical protein